MRAEINSRITDSHRHNPIKPAPTLIKQRQIHCSNRVVRHMSRWKRWPGAISIGLIGKADGRFFEERHKFGARRLQFDHAHTLDWLGTLTLNGRLQNARNPLPEKQ